LLKISKAEYTKNVLKMFNMSNAKHVNVPLGDHFKMSMAQAPIMENEKALMSEVLYASTLGSLMYTMICTRPDNAQAVGIISKYISNLGKGHWRAIKWILRYLKKSSDMTLCYDSTDIRLHGYVDSDFVCDADSQKSIIGYIITLESGPVS